MEAGYATIQFSGQNLDKSVYVGIKNNVYNIPNCSINGQTTENTLEQRYHYNLSNFEYKLRCAIYVLFILISIVGTYVVCAKEESVKTSYLIYAVLTVSYMCLTFVYDGSVWLSPTWCEAVTNFLHYGQNESIWFNIMQTDAGYWPLFQRLLALIIIKGLRLPAYYALFVMQAAAYFISGLILSFFSKYQFKEYFSLKYRYLLSLLFMTIFIEIGTEVFISFFTYGFLIIMFYFLVDSKVWSRREFITICVFSCLTCVSKGTYVTVLPFMIVCTILFYKNYSKRDFTFSVMCAAGSGIQLLYYLTHGMNWIDRNGNAGLDYYYLKLILQSVIDVPRQMLVFLGEKINFFSGISFFIIIGFWLFFIYIFLNKIIFTSRLKEKTDRHMQVFFMAVIYIFAQSLFLRITVIGITKEDIFSDGFWTLTQISMKHRYQISISVAVIILFMAVVKIWQEKNIRDIQMKSVLILMLCFIIGQTRLQLKGIGNDNYVAVRTNFSEITAEYSLFKNLENVSCRMVPIQTNEWIYSKNVSVYCLGEDIYAWPVTCNDFEMEETWTGSVTLGNYPIKTDVEIWQVFITKINLIERSNYKILLLDSAGNIIHQQYQDNTNYQKLTSFTFDTGISDVNQIVILDDNDNRVYIENSMYIVTEKGQQYFME